MSEVWGVWFLIGAALVFFMQCGFAMVETGFTRAKNAKLCGLKIILFLLQVQIQNFFPGNLQRN